MDFVYFVFKFQGISFSSFFVLEMCTFYSLLKSE